MNRLFECPSCRISFNQDINIPKVLPCSDMVCQECLDKKSIRFLSQFFYECTMCKKETTVSEPSQLPENKLVLNLNQKTKIDSNIFNTFESELKLGYATINKHHDQVINNIDIKTEFLILQLNNSRNNLIEKINQHRDQALRAIDHLNEETKSQKTELETETFSDTQIINDFSHLQTSLYLLKQNLYTFEEIDLKKNGLLGYVINQAKNKNFFKIKNLKDNISNHLTFRVKLNGQDNLSENSIRQYIFPLSRNKIVKIYFSLKRDLTLELFDQNGRSIKRVKALDNMSSFPVVCNYDKFICISATGNAPEQDAFFSRFSHLVLYDWDLNCIKKEKKSSMIESIYMNENNLFLTYSHRSTDICEMLNYDLVQVGSFGQQINKDEGFFFEKNDFIYRSSQRELNFPKIFGCTDQHFFMYDKFHLIRMARKTGQVENVIDLNGESCSFFLDKQQNIIKVSSQAKQISFLNFKDDISITSNFSFNFDDVFVSSDDYLVFCDTNKEYVNFF